MNVTIVLLVVFNLIYLFNDVGGETINKLPTVVIVSLIRNKAHTLPYFLTYLEKLEYPKDRISLWFRSDHNDDKSVEILLMWLHRTSSLYHNVDFDYDEERTQRVNETSSTHWPVERHLDIIQMKEEALNYAREKWSDYVFFLDADVFLTYSEGLQNLVKLNLPVVAPMLISDGLYSNFWCGMTDRFYYQRTDEYKEIYHFSKRGAFPVPMIHSAVLVNLQTEQSDFLTFNRTLLHTKIAQQNLPAISSAVPLDDIIIFSISANYSDTQLYISNQALFGFIMVPLEENEEVLKDLDQLTNLKMLILNDVDGVTDGIPLNKELAKYAYSPEKDTMTLSKIYMINLARRPERRQKMVSSFDELGLEVTDFAAVDGSLLTDESIAEIGIKFLTGYADPYHNRPMTLGEIGCFLSHYHIWQEIVEEGLEEVLILEDDIRFEPYFKERAIRVLHEARNQSGWDLIYLGRKRLENQDEKWVDNTDVLVHAGYSYWTLGYIITLEGAKKLLAAKPLEKLIPVDEFLPIMFNQHLNTTWKEAFETRNLIAWSAAPLILFPTHYTGEEGYISDTEDSDLIQSDEDNGKEKKGKKENYQENLNAIAESDDVPKLLDENNEQSLIDAQNLLIAESVGESLTDAFSLKNQHSEL